MIGYDGRNCISVFLFGFIPGLDTYYLTLGMEDLKLSGRDESILQGIELSSRCAAPSVALALGLRLLE